jgi:hypothetical protein
MISQPGPPPGPQPPPDWRPKGRAEKLQEKGLRQLKEAIWNAKENITYYATMQNRPGFIRDLVQSAIDDIETYMTAISGTGLLNQQQIGMYFTLQAAWGTVKYTPDWSACVPLVQNLYDAIKDVRVGQ